MATTSADLQDEVEAINSIYGDGTLVASPGPDEAGVYILRLPSASSTLRIHFPATYPATHPPDVLGTQSTGEQARRGAATRELALFRDAVAAAYQPGQVCLYDAIEQFAELVVAAGDNDEDAATGAGGNHTEEVAATPASTPSISAELLASPPPWVLSEPLTESKSTFLARCAPVTSAAQAAAFIAHLLATDKRAAAATHNITAWRVRGADGRTTAVQQQDSDDDGETAAGGRLLRLLQLADVWGAVVVVTRWYGGVKLGPRRFALINQAARDALVRAGMIAGGGDGRAAGKGKGAAKVNGGGGTRLCEEDSLD